MASLNSLFNNMSETVISGATDELLIINPDTRQIDLPGNELVFGVESDQNGERKYFQCSRYVGNNIDLASCFVRVNYRNANGEIDFDLVDDLTVDGDNVVFSWEVSGKAVAYKGQVNFVVCFTLPGTKPYEWHTTVTTGIALEGLEPDSEAVEAASADGITQILALVDAQTAAVEAVGAEQVGWVETTGAEQIIAVEQAASDAEAASVAEIEAKGVNTLNSIPDDYTALSEAVGVIQRGMAPGIVCEAEGAAIALDDASNHAVQSLRIFGKSTQDGVPTPDAPVEIVSIVNPTVSVDEQTLRINRTLPGIPVTSGGNYTDSDGQQWICDEVDLARGVYVQRVDIASPKVWTDSITTNGTKRFSASVQGKPYLPYVGLCDMYTHTGNDWGLIDGGFCANSTAKIYGIIYVTDSARFTTVDDINAFVATNPITFALALATPIETPLSDAEINVFRALHTNKPNTTIINDSGAHMVVEYVADTKLYIDKKIAALTA